MSLNDSVNWTTTSRFGVWLLSAVLAIAVAGCDGESNPLSGAKIYPVKGKVTLPDGKPLAAGTVVFVATKSTITSPAEIASDGSFVFKGGANADGLPEGEYKVRLEVGGAAGAKKGALPFPARYADEDASELTATVKPDEASNNFDFKLTASIPKASASASRRGH